MKWPNSKKEEWKCSEMPGCPQYPILPFHSYEVRCVPPQKMTRDLCVLRVSVFSTNLNICPLTMSTQQLSSSFFFSFFTHYFGQCGLIKICQFYLLKKYFSLSLERKFCTSLKDQGKRKMK